MLHALRFVIGGVGAGLLALGLVLLAGGGLMTWPGIQLAVVGGLGIAIALFEQLRYGSDPPRSPGLRPTDERFIDPTTGRRMRVWIDPASGERSYHPDDGDPAA